MFHNNIKLAGYKQYYYGFNATRMDKKELKWIKQVSGIISILENIFWSNLLILYNLWVVGINSKKLGVKFINIGDSVLIIS
jgi:hypothetical protein